MKAILILAVSALCVFSAKADDDYATVVRYLGENGHYIISPDDVAKVQAFMKANGYQHVADIPKSAAAAFDSLPEPHATEAVPSATPEITHIVVPSATPQITQIVVPSATPESSSSAANSMLLLIFLVGFAILIYFMPSFVAAGHHNHGAIIVLNLFLGWTFLGWVIALVWACTKSEQRPKEP
jgi:hypothetical protein